MELDPTQELAVQLVCSAPFGIITGSPGTGKSTCLRVALDRLDVEGITYALASPTGKAARRMSEATGRPASTIHRLLGWTWNGWTHNADCPLEADVVVIDEVSMMDVELAAALVEACSPRTRLIFVGDADQLPSVGPGRILADLVESETVPVARLTHVHRAAAESWICRNAPRVLAGQELELTPCPDFRYFEANDAEEAARVVRKVVAQPEYRGAQILAPQRNTPCGVEALNLALQAELNPPRGSHAEWKLGDKVLRKGDRVIQTLNAYKLQSTTGELGVFNGEVGEVVDVAEKLTVDFGDRKVPYTKEDAFHLDLAYALTTHKCVAPDTLVETTQGLLPISAIAGLGTVATADGPKAYDCRVSNPPARALRIVCEGGYELTVTPDHRMMAWTGAAYELQEADQLTAGQFLRLRMGVTVEPAREPDLPPPPERTKREHHHDIPERMTPAVAEFLGLMVADGTVYKSGFRLVKRHPDVAMRFAGLCRELFGVAPTTQVRPTDYLVEVSSTYLMRWLLTIEGLAPNRKAVPGCVLRSSSQTQAAFLRGLFEDGTVNVRDNRIDHIQWTNKSPEMARIVQVMLLRLGMITSRVERRGLSSVYLYGQNAVRFRESVGFVSAWKNFRLMGTAGDEVRSLVPVNKAVIGRDTSAERNAHNRGYVSRHAAAALNEPQLEQALGFHHARIVALEETVSPSMCVRVPGHGRFLQNGFDGSNSQGSEFPWVICVVHSAHTFMLSRQLFYTAITRAKKGVIIVGNAQGLRTATSAKMPPKRNTTLVARMRECAADNDNDDSETQAELASEQLSW
jgi:hypothetical protein